MLTRNDLSAIQKIVKEEVQSSEKRLGSEILKVRKELNSKISKVQETVDIVQEVVVKHYGKLDQRVTSIEEELHSPKN